MTSKGTQPNIHMYPSSSRPPSQPGCHTKYLSSPFPPTMLISSQFLARTLCTPASCLCIVLGRLLGIPSLPLLFSCLLLFKAQPKCRLAYQLPQVSSLAECTTSELQVKFYLGQNEDCILGDSTSESSERLLQRGNGDRKSVV